MFNKVFILDFIQRNMKKPYKKPEPGDKVEISINGKNEII